MHRVLAELGYGHREAVYQRALTVELMHRKVPSLTEVPVPFFTRGLCVGSGRIDILTKAYILELKAVTMTKAMLHRCQQQTRKYIRAMRIANQNRHTRSGIIIFIDSDRLKLYIRRCS